MKETSNWQDKMNAIFARNPINFSTLQAKTKIGKDLEEAIKKAIPRKSQLYNIHRRTTNGRVDQPVIWRVNEQSANMLIDKFLKASEKVNAITGKTECMFYEKVLQNKVTDIYDNDCDITKEK